MFGGLTSNALEQISVVEELISIHESVMGGKDAQTRRGMKLYAVSSCVTRLYAIYENFIESIISDFLDAIPDLLPYASLAEELKIDYRIGISHILSRIDSERYNHLNHENIIRWYHEALTNASTYRFVTEAITRHDQNLRLPIVNNLFSRIQLKDLQGWLAHSQEACALYTEQTNIYEQLEAEVRNFIQLRNDAAHGVLDDLEGRDSLERHCGLMKALVLAISAYLHKSLLHQRNLAGKVKKIGQVTEVYPRAGAFVAKIADATEICKGMRIHLVGPSYCVAQEIQSLQVNDVDVGHVVTDQEGFEVGVKCTNNPKMHAEIYMDV